MRMRIGLDAEIDQISKELPSSLEASLEFAIPGNEVGWVQIGPVTLNSSRLK